MVRHPNVGRIKDWDNAPRPALIVEVLSRSTRRRDHLQKRNFYIETGVEEFWIADPTERSIRSIRSGRADEVVTTWLTWAPSQARELLRVDVRSVFNADE